MKMLRSYVENGVTITVYPEKQVKRRMWQKNDTFYASKMRVGDEVGTFVQFSRKPGKA